MKKIVDWINSHKIITVYIAFLLLVVQPFFVHLILKIPAPSPFFVREWNAGDLITYVAGFEAFIGSVFLGVVALSQTKAAIKQTKDANDISKMLLENEEKRDIFERGACVLLTRLKMPCISLPLLEAHQQNLFLADGLELSNTRNNISILELYVLNSSKSAITLELVSFHTINHNVKPPIFFIEGSKDKRISPSSSVLQQNEEICIKIADSFERNFLDYPMHDCQLSLLLRNSIGEKCFELITFTMNGITSNPGILDAEYNFSYVIGKNTVVKK